MYQHDFNPHSHAGSDGETLDITEIVPISIHTPTQGVTLIANVCNGVEIFQSTLPRRE